MLTHDSFAEKVIKAFKGETGIVEPSFVYLPGVAGGEAIAKATGTEFFSVPIELGVCFPLPPFPRPPDTLTSYSPPALKKP